MTTPKEDGYWMPGEFEPHALTWMAFPHRSDNWRNNANIAQKALCDLANLVSKFERVIMIVPRKCIQSPPLLSVNGFYSRELLLGGGNLHCLTQKMTKTNDKCKRVPIRT